MKILVLPGDGIGPEITQATLTVLNVINAKFKLGLEWDQRDIGLTTLKSKGSTLPPDVMQAARAAPGIILGPVDHLQYPEREKGGINPSGEFRVKLDLFANIRPAISRMGVGLTGKPIDLVIFRECTEGFYGDRNMFMGRGEFMPTEDMAMAVRKVTARQSQRIAKVAFDWARRRRKKVTAVHKANVLTVSDGLFLREVHKVAKDYPDVELDEKIVDAMAALLVRNPTQFDCIVTTNMFGDILSDEASEISGSLGLAASTMAGDDACCAQAQHGAAPDIAGQDKANPTSLLLSAGMLLDWLGDKHQRREFNDAARLLEKTVDAALQKPETRTPDLGGKLGTQAFAQLLATGLK
ncbi:MAG: isocitrate/isopropylmalate dehydrogenase family protein [Betaproteobacteria bacterium]|nr:isocitrate/isopropylmalate dehydrogenase family protein [Betaproteobacteria bacterium]